MARIADRHPGNAPGDWYVDTRCIDCGACRQLDPDVFVAGRNQSLVARQPGAREGDQRAAWRASVACPTQSIGTQSRQRRPAALFPQELSDGVFYCGYNSEHSFGANSFFVARPGGRNLLVDSPRWTRFLAEPLAAMGGIDHILLTHSDDVADAARWAEHFGARVWIHEHDRHAAPFASDILEGDADVTIADDLIAIPLAGHTRGSVAYLLEGRYLFSGDSLAWDPAVGDLTAFRGACWYSWAAQTRSLARLAGARSFEWVLAGHGDRQCRPADEMHSRLVALVSRMRSR